MKRSSALLKINAKRPKIDLNALPINLTVRKALAERIASHCTEAKQMPIYSVKPLDIEFTKSGHIVTQGLINTDVISCIAYLIFGTDVPRYAALLKTFVERCNKSDRSNNGSDMLVKLSMCLETQLIIFIDRQYPPRCINPYWEEQTFNGKTGSIIINYDSILGAYEPVVGYNFEDVYQYKPDENIILKSSEGIQKSVALSVLVANASTMFKLKTYNCKSIDTDLDERSLTKFIDFVNIPASFQPKLADDVKLYEFCLTWKIHSLSRIIRESVYNSTDVIQFSVFLNNIERYDNHMVKAFFKLLQQSNLVLLNQLPVLKHDIIQNRIDTMVDFHENFRDFERLKESHYVIRIDQNNAYIFIDDWKVIPVNECLFDILPILTSAKKYTLWNDTLVFLKGSELGHINLFTPYEKATYSKLPNWGPDLKNIQICKSNKQLLYLFDPETNFFANIDETFNVETWTKLKDKEYLKVKLRDTTFDAFIIRYRNADNTVEEEILLSKSEKSKIVATISGYNIHLYSMSRHFEQVEKETTYEKNFMINTTAIPVEELSNNEHPIFELQFVEKLNRAYAFVIADSVILDRHVISILN